MANRYDKRSLFFNREELYKDLIKERNLNNGLRHYSTPMIEYPTVAQVSSLTRIKHIWRTGDRYYKLAIDNYGSAEYWWVIAFFNQKPTEADLKVGDVVEIPFPLERILGILDQ